MSFSLYSMGESGEDDTPLWTERYESVSVIDGVFTVQLGSQTELAGLPLAVSPPIQFGYQVAP